MPIITQVVSFNTAHGDVYIIDKTLLIKAVSDLRHVIGFLYVLKFHPPTKLIGTIHMKYYPRWRQAPES